MTENGIQCEPALAAAADIPQLLAAALSPLRLPYLLRCRVIFLLSAPMSPSNYCTIPCPNVISKCIKRMLCCSNLDDLEKWQRPLCRALYVSVTGNRNADTNSHSPNLTFSQRGLGGSFAARNPHWDNNSQWLSGLPSHSYMFHVLLILVSAAQPCVLL